MRPIGSLAWTASSICGGTRPVSRSAVSCAACAQAGITMLRMPSAVAGCSAKNVPMPCAAHWATLWGDRAARTIVAVWTDPSGALYTNPRNGW